MKALFRFSAIVVILAAVVLLHGRATAPVVEAETTQEAVLAGLTSGNADIDKLILETGLKFGVDPKLIYYVIRQESRFKPQALSNKNAQGLMQLIPATAERFHVGDIKDPEQNIEGGVRYLRWLLKRFNGDVNLALAGYNAGEGAVEKCGNKVPDYKETKEYVAKITRAYGKTYHPVLEPEQARVEFATGLAASE
ncbi:MAG TPA: lytic transglycosylase domain-containing protein [Blastocatellia bacterium]|nr:lytic transglycosylase domain-containing protein [Blastocatellia bacterium]